MSIRRKTSHVRWQASPGTGAAHSVRPPATFSERPACPLAILPASLLAVLLLGSCTGTPESGAESGTGTGTDTGTDTGTEPGTETGTEPGTETGADAAPETLQPTEAIPIAADNAQPFPPDLDEDDREGLVVTGLNGLSATDVVSPWLAVSRSFRSVSDTEAPGDGEVLLTRYADDFPVSAHLDYLDIPVDSCVLRSADSAEAETDNPPPASISGGQTVVINTPSGPWFSFEATNHADGQTSYRATDLLPGALPEQSSLSIPGSSFPTMAAYLLYEPEAVERLEPDVRQEATAESSLRWVPGEHNTLVKIDWMAFSEEGDVVEFPVSCFVRDDGAFQPSVTTQAALATMTRRLEVRYSRIYARLDVINGMVFYQESEIAE